MYCHEKTLFSSSETHQKLMIIIFSSSHWQTKIKNFTNKGADKGLQSVLDKYLIVIESLFSFHFCFEKLSSSLIPKIVEFYPLTQI